MTNETDLETSNSKRIEWLEKAYKVLREELLPEAPESISITFGFPSKGARKSARQCLGEYAHDFLQQGETKAGFISIHPTVFENPPRVLDVLLHEMIHAATPGEKHQGNFVKLARRAGLIGKATTTYAGPELGAKFRIFLEEKLPAMPAGYGNFELTEKKQTVRMRKYICPSCKQIIRAATDELDAICGVCKVEFELAPKKGEE